MVFAAMLDGFLRAVTDSDSVHSLSGLRKHIDQAVHFCGDIMTSPLQSCPRRATGGGIAIRYLIQNGLVGV